MKNFFTLKSTSKAPGWVQIELAAQDNGTICVVVEGCPLNVRQIKRLSKWLAKAGEVQAIHNHRFNYKADRPLKKRPKPNKDKVLDGQLAFQDFGAVYRTTEYRYEVKQ